MRKKYKGEKMESVKILAIGNSFSVDCMEYVYEILKNLGVREIKLGDLYIGGCPLIRHCENARDDAPAYEYYTNDSGEWRITPEYKMSDAICSEEWDFIFTQQYSGHSGMAETYTDLDELLAYVKSLVKGTPKYAWQMTWAYAKDSTHPAFVDYDSSQEKMYTSILNAVQTKIAIREDVEKIIPSGTAIQNMREKIGDVLNRDGFHLSYDLGRYVAGLCVVKALTGLDINGVSYMPEGVSEEQRSFAIAAANAACENLYSITKI